MDKRRNCSEKLFVDLPQRVIVHKILIYHQIRVNQSEEDPYLLFGYFKYDRLRNIWFVFPSILFSRSQGHSEIANRSTVINYSKLFSIFFSRTSFPTNLTELSSKMYSVRSIGCFSKNRANTHFPESFYSNSKFPKLKSFSLSCRDQIVGRNWNDCNFFDELEYLKLHVFSLRKKFAEFDCSGFFQSKFRNNLKKITLRNINLRVKIIVCLPNLEMLELLECENLYIIPSEKKLKKINLDYCSPGDRDESKKIAKNSRNARSIEIGFCCEDFFSLFEEKDFPNLEVLRIKESLSSVLQKKWDLCYHLKEFSVTFLRVNPGFFQNNDWNHLERLTISNTRDKILMGNVKFPSLRFLEIDFEHGFISDEFFCFEAKRLERLNITSVTTLTGNGWNEDIFKNLRVLKIGNGFCDSFFQTYEFPNLRKLILCKNDSLNDRESWREMKSLEEFEIEGGHDYFLSWKRT